MLFCNLDDDAKNTRAQKGQFCNEEKPNQGFPANLADAV